jgi:histidinol phosphatase-like PHP family hydrolase
MFSRFEDHGVEFALGSDSHRPDELTDRVPALQASIDDAAIELVEIDEVLA